MRFTKTLCLAATTVGLAFSAGPALAADGGPEYVWEPGPDCGPGSKAVWVDRPATPPFFEIDPRTGRITFNKGEPPFVGWECQPSKLVVIGP
jgi:hypothetical protein